MTTRRVEDVGTPLRTLFALGSASGLADRQLLERFATGDEASGLAFQVLVERHGPMVLRVCRGVLGDPHDAQDAFQATFLVLVRKARSIRDRDSVASWLHGVALRVANHARSDLARRRRHERIKGELSGTSRAKESGDDLSPRLQAELGRLPDRYRAPVVLCYLEGHTCEDAARLLRWPVGTVKSRLSRARERLRRGLGRPDWEMSPMILALPPRLAPGTAGLAARFGAGSLDGASGAAKLAEGVLRMMTLSKLKWPATALLAAASWLGTSSALTPGQSPPDPKAPAPPSKITPTVQATSPDPSALVAPRDLAATAGSGRALMYALDDRGERILDEPAADPKQPRPPRQVGPWKETEKDLRWVAVVGLLDNPPTRAIAAGIGKAEPRSARLAYKRIEGERQVRQPDGRWSGWVSMDRQKDHQIFDNIPELDRERTPNNIRPDALNDPLPFLRKGSWSGVDPEVLLRRPTPPDPPEGGLLPSGMMGVAGGIAGQRRPLPPLGPLLMIRWLDFTVEPGKAYRYRVRVVVASTEDARGERPGVILGPWSEPSTEVAVR